MLKKRQRLTKEELDSCFKVKHIRNQYMGAFIRVIPLLYGQTQGKVAVLIPKKAYKKAHERNMLKRTILMEFRAHSGLMKFIESKNIIYEIKKTLPELDLYELLHELHKKIITL